MQISPARLEVVAGNAVGMSILVQEELVIGRHAEGPGRLADDEEISRLHARVMLEDGRCMVEDLGSTNGTFVNGLRISGPQTLAVGDTVELGQTTLVIRELPNVAEPEPGPAALQPTIVPLPGAPPRAAAPPVGAPPSPSG